MRSHGLPKTWVAIPGRVQEAAGEITDTVRWFSASYAALTELNGWNYSRFAGLPANEESKELEQQSLKEWWSVTDRASDENHGNPFQVDYKLDLVKTW